MLPFLRGHPTRKKVRRNASNVEFVLDSGIFRSLEAGPLMTKRLAIYIHLFGGVFLSDFCFSVKNNFTLTPGSSLCNATLTEWLESVLKPGYKGSKFIVFTEIEKKSLYMFAIMLQIYSYHTSHSLIEVFRKSSKQWNAIMNLLHVTIYTAWNVDSPSRYPAHNYAIMNTRIIPTAYTLFTRKTAEEVSAKPFQWGRKQNVKDWKRPSYECWCWTKWVR